MKPLPPPNIPGNTEAERFNNALRMVLSVPKEALDKQESKLRTGKARKKRAKERADQRALSR